MKYVIPTPSDIIIERLKRSVFLVEANSFEQLTLWQQHAIGSPHQKHFNFTPLRWEQMDGYAVNVGKIGKRELWVTLTWNRLNGCLVCFYDESSQLRDLVQTKAWFDKYFKTRSFIGSRAAQCDAMNFGHCISAIKEHNRIIGA